MAILTLFLAVPLAAAGLDEISPVDQVKDPIKRIEADELYDPIPDLAPPGETPMPARLLKQAIDKPKKSASKVKPMSEKEQEEALEKAIRDLIADKKDAQGRLAVEDPVLKKTHKLARFGLAKVGTMSEEKGVGLIWGRLDFRDPEQKRWTVGFKVRASRTSPKVLAVAILREDLKPRPKKEIRWVKP